MQLLKVSRAGGLCLLAGPEGHVCTQVPAPGRDDGQPEPQPGVNAGAAGSPLRQGTHSKLHGVWSFCNVYQIKISLLAKCHFLYF